MEVLPRHKLMRVAHHKTGHRTGGSAFEGRRKEEQYPKGMQKHNTGIRHPIQGPATQRVLLAPSMNRRPRQVKHLGLFCPDSGAGLSSS